LDFVQNFHLFLLTFLIDFFLGSFEQSPLSFSYSFLFLGLIFAQDEFNKKKLLLYFLGAQIILSFFNGEGFYLIGIINGFLITSLFSLLFPLWLIIFFLPSKMTLTSFLYDLFNFSMEIFLKTILSLNEFTKIFERHFTSIPLIFLVLAISSSISFQLKKNILIFVLFIHSNPLYNFPLQFFKKEYEFVHFKSLKGKKIDRFKTQKNGFKIFFKNGKVCSYAQKRAGYKERCSFK
jgi:competence protein ComEC